MAVFKAVAGDRAGELMAGIIRGFSGQSDTSLEKVNSRVLSGLGKGESMKVDYAKIEAIYKQHGFHVEKVPYFREDFALHLYDKMSPEEIDRLLENIKRVHVWKVTVDPDSLAKAGGSSEKAASQPTDAELPFAVQSEIRDGVFSVSIQGRMDTITAPELLKRFQEADQPIKAIHVDVSKMAYVSSAGLRVLLMMYKSLEDKSGFQMTGVSDGVREILATTGFDQILFQA